MVDLLLKSKSKETIICTCQQAFLSAVQSNGEFVSEHATKWLAGELEIGTKDAKDVFLELAKIIKEILGGNPQDNQALIGYFREETPENLKAGLSKTIGQNLATWREEATNHQVSLPRLKEFDWRIDVKSGSDALTRLQVPTCLLELKVSQPELSREKRKVHNLEMTKENLDTMLLGLNKIREQLSSLTTT
ncbi:COMM domain-containing protein 9 [Oopsacas minuta]|uniref:COMM domain-containing protein 9 n=1 Tax=Oopsacas minuta TaxID=111878 RepID=A0AAV7K6M7_9METZ|nr:COMM domain-containing protein 9 [Oopsacas minuta]